jgi:ParB family chromosome partitioning protein
MSPQKRGIGRGLEAILSASPASARTGQDELRELALDLISPNVRQPRGRFDEDTLAALAASLGERGVLQPVLVRPKPGGTYELVAGERRWRAARLAGLDTIPALVRPRADAEALELALIENMAREDLNPIDEARACAALVEELGLTREEVGRRVGRGRVAVTNLMRLLDLPDEVIDLVEQGALSEGHGRALLLAEDHQARRSLGREAAAAGWSVRVTEANARESNGDEEAVQRAVARRRRTPAPLHPDAEQAANEIAEALADALGTEVSVKPRREGGYRVELSFSTPEEALELARSVRAGSPA